MINRRVFFLGHLLEMPADALWRIFLKVIRKLLGKPRTLIKYVQDRPGHDRRYAIDYTKAEQELGWKPQVPFERGLAETIEWYKTNSDWVKNVRSGEYLKYYAKQYGES